MKMEGEERIGVPAQCNGEHEDLEWNGMECEEEKEVVMDRVTCVCDVC